MMKFSEMPYERPDMKTVGAAFDAVTQKAAEATDVRTVIDAVLDYEKLVRHAATAESLAYIRHSIDTRDAFYDAENDYIDQVSPQLEEKRQAFMKTLLESKFRPQLEERFGRLLFVNAEIAAKAFKPELIPQLQEINRLSSEYSKLMAGARIEFDGETRNLSQLTPYKQAPDREVRRSAYCAEGSFFAAHGEELDRIYDDMVRQRTQVARRLGYDNFVPVGYLNMTRNCYDAEMVASFRRQVVRDIVPLVCKLKKMQSERIGIPQMKFYDDIFCYREGNPKPCGSADDLLASGKRMYEEMSPKTGEFIHFMYDNQLMDVLARDGKSVGGYCADLEDYKAPFIFANFNGTSGDVDVLTHEAGHAYAGYCCRDFELAELAQPTLESCEIHSMSMEFFAWPWLELYYGDDADRARFHHLESALTFIPYGTMVDHFQHIVYENPDMTPAERHAEWLKLEKIYRPYLDFGDVPFYKDGRGWQRQIHIYQSPFYYIDYCLAQTMALMFWSLNQKDHADAWERYNRLVSKGGTQTFVELCATAGLPNPFAEGSLKEIADTAMKFLS